MPPTTRKKAAVAAAKMTSESQPMDESSNQEKSGGNPPPPAGWNVDPVADDVEEGDADELMSETLGPDDESDYEQEEEDEEDGVVLESANLLPKLSQSPTVGNRWRILLPISLLVLAVVALAHRFDCLPIPDLASTTQFMDDKWS